MSHKTDWQPIETAPKDGRPIWICEAHGFQYGAWLVDGKWQPWGPNVYAIVPTHWMPLPAPPAIAKAEGR